MNRPSPPTPASTPVPPVRWLLLAARSLLFVAGVLLVAYGAGILLFLLATLTPYFTFGADTPTSQVIAGALLYIATGYGVIYVSSFLRRR